MHFVTGLKIHKRNKKEQSPNHAPSIQILIDFRDQGTVTVPRLKLFYMVQKKVLQ